MTQRCYLHIKYKILPVAPQEEIKNGQNALPLRTFYRTFSKNPALRNYFTHITSHIKSPMLMSTILFNNWRCRQVLFRGCSIVEMHPFVVFTSYSQFRKETMDIYLSFVHMEPARNVVWDMRYTYDSLRVFLNLKSFIMHADNSIGIK